MWFLVRVTQHQSHGKYSDRLNQTRTIGLQYTLAVTDARYARFPYKPMMIKTTLIPLTTPATVPTVCINATGSLDVEAIDFIYRKNPTANRMRTKPVMIILKFLRRIAASFAKMCWRVIVNCNPHFRVKGKLNTNAS